MAFEDHYQVLYSNGAPAEPIRLGQLLVDESYSPPKLMKCTSLSPLVYTEVGAGGAPTGATYITESDETTDLPNSFKLVAGANISFDTMTPNELEISATGGSSGPVVFRGTFVSPVGPLNTSAPNVYMIVPVACTITGATVLAQGGTGSCIIDVRTGAYASYPTVATICGGARPTISSSNKAQDTTLTGWTVALAAGDVLAFVLESTSVFTAITIQLDAQI